MLSQLALVVGVISDGVGQFCDCTARFGVGVGVATVIASNGVLLSESLSLLSVAVLVMMVSSVLVVTLVVWWLEVMVVAGLVVMVLLVIVMSWLMMVVVVLR